MAEEVDHVHLLPRQLLSEPAAGAGSAQHAIPLLQQVGLKRRRQAGAAGQDGDAQIAGEVRKGFGKAADLAFDIDGDQARRQIQRIRDGDQQPQRALGNGGGFLRGQAGVAREREFRRATDGGDAAFDFDVQPFPIDDQEFRDSAGR